MDTFSPYHYAQEHGWDFTCIEATAERGLSDADEEAIDRWAGVRGVYYDPPTDEAAEAEAIAVEIAEDACEALLAWCKARVADANAEARS